MGDTNVPEPEQSKPHRKRLVFLVLFVAIIVMAVAGAPFYNSRHDKPAEQTPVKTTDQNTPQGSNGQQAIDKLGEDLPAVAEKNGFTPEELKETLLQDETLFVDEDNNLYYVEPPLEEMESDPEESLEDADLSESEIATIETAATTTDQAFELASYPQSDKTIYLDFTGHTTTGTAWNRTWGDPIVSAPFDNDGDPATFSETERKQIIDIWTSVSEDFAPFFINVTTIEPPVSDLIQSTTSDNRHGVRVVISKTNFYGSAGGVAFLGTFAVREDAPAFAFHCCTVTKTTSEVVSHEAGHTLGLNHDGQPGVTYYRGHGSWAPIMGNPYSKAISQWSKGEYLDANNQQDDLSVFLNYGVQRVVDEAGATPGTSKPLAATNGILSAQGMIGTTGDTDVYSFAWQGGSATFTLSSPAVGYSYGSTPRSLTNLDAQLRLLNASGQEIATSNPDGVAMPSVTASLPAGSYYIEIKGVGYLDPLSTGYSDYASLGRYTISSAPIVTPPPEPPLPPATPNGFEAENGGALVGSSIFTDSTASNGGGLQFLASAATSCPTTDASCAPVEDTPSTQSETEEKTEETSPFIETPGSYLFAPRINHLLPIFLLRTLFK